MVMRDGRGDVVALLPSEFSRMLIMIFRHRMAGTTEGSRDVGVEKFVMDAMRLGYFPVVLNPRGCAGSPLITPRHLLDPLP